MKTAAFILALVVASLLKIPPAGAEVALKRISDPNGGRIMYGQVEGQSTEAGAMAAVLRQIHTNWGDEPQVGRFFRVRNTDSIATFITGVNHSQSDLQSAGLIIVSQIAPQRVEAALLVDSVENFGGNINNMLAALFQEWHPASIADATSGGAGSLGDGNVNGLASAGGGSISGTPVGFANANAGKAFVAGTADGAKAGSVDGAVAALHKYVLPDGSASASMPDGWQVTPASGQGTIFFKGPNDEMVTLGFTMRPLNSNDPKVRRTMQFAAAAGRNTAYGQALYYPYGGDLGKTFVDLVQMLRAKRGLQPTTVEVSSESSLPASAGWQRIYMTGRSDAHDGVGPREFHDVITCAPPGPVGGFMIYADEASIPIRLADQERQTALAMMSSYSVNQAVVSAQAAAFAAPEIARIHAIGRRAAAQAASAHAMEDAHNAAVEQHWDSMDRQSQSFSNYLLDQSVITNSQGNHATVSNGTADAMVRSNPSRYEYVNTLNLKKGVDY